MIEFSKFKKKIDDLFLTNPYNIFLDVTCVRNDMVENESYLPCIWCPLLQV